MLEITSQVDFIDSRVSNLLSNLQEMQNRVQLALQALEEQDPKYLTLEQIGHLEPGGISMRYLLEQLGLI